MKKLTALLITIWFLVGCQSLNILAEKGAELNDTAVKSAKFTLCQGASVGSIKREFDTAEEAKLWNELCRTEQGFKL